MTTAAEEWCEPDNCPASICGGPHIKIVILDRDELIITREQADRIDASGDTATYNKSLADILAIIEPDWT